MLCALLFALAATPVPDPCSGLLPAPVLAAIAEKYPGHRVSRASDYDGRALRLAREDGSRCPAIASADVDGDGSVDHAFFLLSGEDRLLLVAARVPAAGPVELRMLMDFGSGLGGSYVYPLKAGEYSDMYGPEDFTPDEGRVQRYAARRPGFIAGTIEASAIAYFFTGRRWVHLWLSD